MYLLISVTQGDFRNSVDKIKVMNQENKAIKVLLDERHGCLSIVDLWHVFNKRNKIKDRREH